jgi:hypothetical protein
MAYDIKQITNFSEEVKNAEIEEVEITRVVIKDDHMVEQIEQVGYIELKIENIVKFGYICENRGIGLPIFLKIDGKYQKFEIGKTGMYEASDIDVDGIKIPVGNDKDFNFTFDYVIYNAE